MADNQYALNVVTAKLHGLVGSPTEMVLGTALFQVLAGVYRDWWCRVYSNAEFKGLSPDDVPNKGSVIAIVPQYAIEGVGRVDFALFLPSIDLKRPLVVVECDGHQFHERTPEQASKDRKRDRALSGSGVHALRYTGADILRAAGDAANEIADIFDRVGNAVEERWRLTTGAEINKPNQGGLFVPYQWPRTRTDGRKTHIPTQE